MAGTLKKKICRCYNIEGKIAPRIITYNWRLNLENIKAYYTSIQKRQLQG